jgi:hypothetical protein
VNLLALRERVRREVAVNPTDDLAELLRLIEQRLQALKRLHTLAEADTPPTLGHRQRIAGECLEPAVTPTACLDLVAAEEARLIRRSAPIAKE